MVIICTGVADFRSIIRYSIKVYVNSSARECNYGALSDYSGIAAGKRPASAIIESLEEMKPAGKVKLRPVGKRRGRKSMIVRLGQRCPSA